MSNIHVHLVLLFQMNDKFEITKDVKSQLKFLDELDKLEKKRHEEQEWEKIMKAARLQQAEIERTRQQEANETALAAIGPRKKRKTDFSESSQGMKVFLNYM
ncbi:hypothetical protein KUTeg_019309 [Tegillarca granosa]|uniref:Transcription initiation factor TFIID component TAF4 C-terminal domain-containing protein n=1 Tax=Tegillarca granosa TaxID=220873 RepID=A0ABQ9EC56_TEGGR|nr:hypothetical protein KUTeg_019309 [Tegillarca granosa]